MLRESISWQIYHPKETYTMSTGSLSSTFASMLPQGSSISQVFNPITPSPTPNQDISACNAKVASLQGAVNNQDNVIREQQQNIDYLNTNLPLFSK
jgi:hypothetical protein